MKKSWGNQSTQPEYQIKDNVYQSSMESCMILENNKKVYQGVFSEINTNYRDQLGKKLKDTKS